MARILVASTGMLSSVFVAAEFCRRLVRDGHEVVLVTTEKHGDRVREFGLAFRAMPLSSVQTTWVSVTSPRPSGRMA